MTPQQIADVYEIVWDGSVRPPGVPPPAPSAPLLVDRVQPPRPRGGTRERILSVLASQAGPMSPQALAELSGATTGSVSSILSRLVQSGDVVHVAKGGRWTPGLYQVKR